MRKNMTDSDYLQDALDAQDKELRREKTARLRKRFRNRNKFLPKLKRAIRNFHLNRGID